MLQRVKLYSDRRGAVIALTAPHGHGKTTLARWIYDTLSLQQHEAVFLTLYKPENNAGWLLPRLCEFFGIALGSFQATQNDIVQDIAVHIEEIQEEGRQLTLIIDEADKIQTNDAFAEIHALTSIHSAIETCINIILIGGNELIRKLEGYPPLMSRMVFHAHYDPLTMEETDAYIDYRLDGAQLGRQTITNEARLAIASLSGGIYSMINTLGDNSLVEAYLCQKRLVDQEMVEKAASFLNLSAQKGRRFSTAPSSEPQARRGGKEAPASIAVREEANVGMAGPGPSLQQRSTKETKGNPQAAQSAAKTQLKAPSGEPAIKETAGEKKSGTLTSLFYKDKDDGS